MEDSIYIVRDKDYIKDGYVLSKGYGIIPSSVMDDETLSKEAKILYTYLVCKSGGANCCYPSNKTIMKALGIQSIISLRKYKDELLFIGLLKIKERKQKSGRLTSNSYFPTKFKIEKKEDEDWT